MRPWPSAAVTVSAALSVLAVLVACTATSPAPSGPRVSGPPSATEAADALPRQVVIAVRDRSTDDPIAGALVDAAGATAVTDASGEATLTLESGSGVDVSATGYDRRQARIPDGGSLVVELRAHVASGIVTDGAGTPLADVRVFVDGAPTYATTDAGGRYELVNVPEDATLVFKRAGYRLGVIEVGDGLVLGDLDVALERFEARALYAPAGTFETPGRLEQLLELIDATEVNALVIDVKEPDGRLYYATDLPAAVEVGAVRETPILDLGELLPMLRERGIYTIARMVVMKDDTLAAARPELAVRNAATGGPWRDNLGDAWLDPAAPGVGEYAAAIAVDLAERGFDEVQLDYIRFYSDGPYAVADTNVPNTQAFRLPALRRVLRTVSDAMATERAFLAADVFPISFIHPNDQGIGQRPEVVMPFVDYVCPMAYPSHYGPLTFGLPVPNDHPYEVVDQTLEIFNAHAEEWPVAVRPWIQDFGYTRFPPYTPEQVQAQMEAAEARGAHGWMVWNPQGRFSEPAFGPPRPDEDAGPITTPAPPAAPRPSP